MSGHRWSVVGFLDYGDHGRVARLTHEDGRTECREIPVGEASGLPLMSRPVFLGLTAGDDVILLDPHGDTVSVQGACPADALPAYAYPEAGTDRIWFMNEGDKKTGTDPVRCGDDASSVTILQRRPGQRPPARVLRSVCVGRGHHVTTFVPGERPLAFVSNLLDGTLSVLENDGRDFPLVGTINLFEADKEDDDTSPLPSRAFPHGMAWSPVTRRLYNLNNGYATIAVIDPATLTIEARIPLPVASNILLHPAGRHLVGKGADRKRDPEHVIGRLAVVDLDTGKVAHTLDLPDIYPSTYRFSPDGRRLFVTTAATGKGAQREHLRIDRLLVFDSSDLPRLEPVAEVTIGRADCGRRPLGYLADDTGAVTRLFLPNPSDGTLTVLDGDLNPLETVELGAPGMREFLFSFWDGAIEAC